MKKLNKVFVSLALVLVLVIPVLVSGCFGGSKEGIKIHTEFKTEYMIGEDLDLTNGKIEYTDKTGKKTVVVITEQMVTGYDKNNAGTRELVITYEGNTLLVEYTVNPYDVELGAVYYQTPFMIAQDFDYGYLKFVSATEAYLKGSDEGPSAETLALLFQGDYGKETFVRDVVNNKVVYNTTQLPHGDNSIIMDITLTVIDETTIKFSIFEHTTTTSLESTFTKYVMA